MNVGSVQNGCNWLTLGGSLPGFVGVTNDEEANTVRDGHAGDERERVCRKGRRGMRQWVYMSVLWSRVCLGDHMGGE